MAGDAENPEIAQPVATSRVGDAAVVSQTVEAAAFLRPAREKRFVPLALRWLCIAVFAALGVYGSMEMLHRTSWYRQRLLQRLYSGDPQAQLRAATALAHFKCQKELLLALRSDSESARELGRRALEHIWFHAAGKEAYDRLQQAHEALEKKEHQRAMAILDRTIDRYPTFAEAWNRRGALHWELGDYEKSLADSERALALNPNHYGAMQGIGVCRLQLGDVAEACRYLRAALRILPHDEAARRSLERCEELLRMFPSPTKKSKTHDVV